MNETEVMLKSDLYRSAKLSEKIQIMIDLKHYSLESGADANVELFKNLLPLAVLQLRKIEYTYETAENSHSTTAGGGK